MDRVDNVGKLQGWRTANAEELAVLQGLLLRDAKLEMKSERILNVFLVIFSYICFAGVWNIFQYIGVAYVEDGISDIVTLGAILIILILIGVASGVMFIKNINMKTAKLYKNAIVNNNIRVNEVEIYEVISLRGVGDGVDGHCVKVKDCHDTYCEEDIIFECCNGYKKTKALLIEVIILKKENEITSRKYVIPCKEYDSKLWNIGVKYYNKNMK